MLTEFKAIFFAFSSIIIAGCSTISEKSFDSVVPLQSIFDSALDFDQEKICSSGFVMTGENVAVYPSRRQAIEERYEIAAILLRNNSFKESDLADNQEVRFCGQVDLQKKCWKPEGDGSFCVPFDKPIHIRVISLQAVVR